MTLDSLQYHDLTGYRRNHMPQHSLDWENQPSTFKTYPDIELIPLPQEDLTDDKTLSHVIRGGRGTAKNRVADITDLSKILRMAYTLTARAAHGGGYHYYRSVASAGALYPTEIYVATHDIKGLRDGLYHFSIAAHALAPLRDGDISKFAGHALFATPEKYPALTFFFTTIFFRSSWKYRDRAYRYHLLDTGHLITNMELAHQAHSLDFRLVFDFEDRTMNRLLGLDQNREGVLAVGHVPGPEIFSPEDPNAQIRELATPFNESSIVSNREIRYAAIQEIHEAGEIQVPASPVVGLPGKSTDTPVLKAVDIKAPVSWPEALNAREVFSRRRSRRNFIPTSLSENALSSLLECLHTDALETIALPGTPATYPNTGLISAHVEGLTPGIYFKDITGHGLSLTAEGRFTEAMAHICLDQMWMANAAIHFFFTGNLDGIDRSWGPRGYRYLMINAGRLGERLYLAATAMGLGCCGVGAFYDGEASRLLTLKKGTRLLYVIALGPVKSI